MDRFDKAKVDNCCFFIPLRAGAFIVAAWIFIWHLYLGIIFFLLTGFTDFGSIYAKIVAVLYLLVALIGFYGVYGIIKEDPRKVALFTKFFLYSIIFNIVMSLLSVISLSIAANNDKKNCERENPGSPCNFGFNFINWLLNFAIGLVIDVYLYIVIRSYSRELETKSTHVPPNV